MNKCYFFLASLDVFYLSLFLTALAVVSSTVLPRQGMSLYPGHVPTFREKHSVSCGLFINALYQESLSIFSLLRVFIGMGVEFTKFFFLHLLRGLYGFSSLVW